MQNEGKPTRLGVTLTCRHISATTPPWHMVSIGEQNKEVQKPGTSKTHALIALKWKCSNAEQMPIHAENLECGKCRTKGNMPTGKHVLESFPSLGIPL